MRQVEGVPHSHGWGHGGVGEEVHSAGESEQQRWVLGGPEGSGEGRSLSDPKTEHTGRGKFQRLEAGAGQRAHS
jgi:hypothetical protein